MAGKTTINITPDKSLIQKLGLTGYKTSQAISELLDNSIDARIDENMQRIDVVLDYTEKAISVSDDGIGMDMQQLQNGLTVAMETKHDSKKLGKFGLGMKSACSTLGQSFAITTATENSDLEYHVCYDENQWLNDASRTWENFEIKTRKKCRPWHGTTVRITKLRIPIYPNQTTTLRKNFGIRYGKYIKSNQISLYLNTRVCKSIEVSIQKGSKKEVNVELAHNNYIKGWIGLLEKRSIKGEYGVHLYKNNRLIKAFDKFGIRNHPEVAKIVGEIHLDHVPVNFHKTGFIEESYEYREAVDKFITNPTVVSTLRSSINKAPPITSIQTVLDYFDNDKIRGKIKPRISRTNAKALLNKAQSFEVQHNSENISLNFDNGLDDQLYDLQRVDEGYKIKINRKSPIFGIVGNPLFLIGMIELEAKSILAEPEKYKIFLKERNVMWNKFVKDWTETREKTPRQKSKEMTLLANYSIVDVLQGLHEFLIEKFEFDFQFTALSTLEPYLQNAYNKMIYNIEVSKGAGQYLYDIITEHKSNSTILLNPSTKDIKNALEYSEKKQFIVIREYSTVSKDTWASPEKAWLDLLGETSRGGHYIRHDELANILDQLIENNLASQDKLETLARHKNMSKKLKDYLGGAT